MLAARVLVPSFLGIFIGNVVNACGSSSIRSVVLHLKGPMYAVPGVRSAICRSIREIAVAMRKEVGLITVVRVSFTATAGRCLAETFDNLRSWLQVGFNRGVFACPCGDPAFRRFRRVEGHIFDSFDKHRPFLWPSGPESWNARARFLPDINRALMDFRNVLEGKLAWRTPQGFHRLPECYFGIWSDLSVRILSLAAAQRCPAITSVSHLHLWFDRLAVGPIDRCRGNLCLMCPKMYVDIAQAFVDKSGWRRVSEAEVGRFGEEFFKFGATLEHLPFSNLRRGEHHRFGSLVLWPKLKTMGANSWAKIKLRPLVAYCKHHWKRLLSLASIACNYIAEAVYGSISFDVASLSDVHRRIQKFNDDGKGFPDKRMAIYCRDIDNFFTKAPRSGVTNSVQTAVQEFHAKFQCRYIAVPSDYGRSARRRWVFARTSGTCQWRTLFSHKHRRVIHCNAPLRGYRCICVFDIIRIISFDWKFGFFRVGAVLYVQVSGFSQGSPASPGACRIFTVVREATFYRQLCIHDQAVFRSGVLAVRWVDDLLLAIRHAVAGMGFVHTLLCSEDFYAVECPLNMSESVFIGMALLRVKGELRTLEWTPFIQNQIRCANSDHLAPRLTCFASFGSKRNKLGITCGHIVRTIDCDHGTRDQLLASISLITGELSSVGIPARIIHRALCEVGRRMPFLRLQSFRNRSTHYAEMGLCYHTIAAAQRCASQIQSMF